MNVVMSIRRANGIARITLDSGDVLRVPSALFTERRLHEGELLDTDEYAQWMTSRAYSHALDRAVKYLTTRDHSAREVRDHLRNAAYTADVIDMVLDTLMKHQVVQDARFAGLWVDARAQKLGRGRIAQELQQKGVDRDTVREALDCFTEEDELEQACIQAEKALRRTRGDMQKALAALVRRGYSFSMAKNALRKAQEDDADIEDIEE